MDTSCYTKSGRWETSGHGPGQPKASGCAHGARSYQDRLHRQDLLQSSTTSFPPPLAIRKALPAVVDQESPPVVAQHSASSMGFLVRRICRPRRISAPATHCGIRVSACLITRCRTEQRLEGTLSTASGPMLGFQLHIAFMRHLSGVTSRAIAFAGAQPCEGCRAPPRAGVWGANGYSSARLARNLRKVAGGLASSAIALESQDVTLTCRAFCAMIGALIWSLQFIVGA